VLRFWSKEKGDQFPAVNSVRSRAPLMMIQSAILTDFQGHGWRRSAARQPNCDRLTEPVSRESPPVKDRRGGLLQFDTVCICPSQPSGSAGTSFFYSGCCQLLSSRGVPTFEVGGRKFKSFRHLVSFRPANRRNQTLKKSSKPSAGRFELGIHAMLGHATSAS
jgi:hypothetical protein